MISFCYVFCLLLQQKQINCKQDDGCQRRKENILIGNKGFRAVTVYDLFRACENHHADIRTDDARNKHLRKDSNALELSRFPYRGEVSDLCAEYRHACEIAAHHQQRANENERCGSEGKEDDIADRKPCEAHGNGERESFAVVYLAPKHCDDRSKHDGGSHDENITGHAERNLIVKNEIGHEDLYGDIKDDECEQIDIQ